ncbi:MAG: competence/damage-inducible protein A [Verrucomicrobia bacterium]|nr:competence/damage-inducible protein A [Verrucomicrobiota bacterium]
MRIEILNTGTELLLGNTLNTHGAWLGRELLPMGLRVARQTTVPDGPAIRESLSEILARADVLIATGGLGPTSDDITRELTAEALGLELDQDPAARRSIEAFFAIRNRPMAEANLKQALCPVGGEILPNPNGTAPGIYLPPALNPWFPCAVFLLPGPPREMMPMFHAEVAPRLRVLSGIGNPPDCVSLKFAGIGESDFHDGIDARLAAIPELEFGYCAHIGEVDLRLIGTPDAILAAREIVSARFGDYLVSSDGSSLEETVVRLLTESRLTLATAESCTGGMISNRLTNVPGSSAVFTHGFVTYANEAKTTMLDVPARLIGENGAVSEPVALAMADGALARSGADLAVAVTGIAGPSGGTPEKPAGTAWLALARKGASTRAWRVFQPRNRLDFKLGISQTALDAVRKSLCGIP